MVAGRGTAVSGRGIGGPCRAWPGTSRESSVSRRERMGREIVGPCKELVGGRVCG